MIDNFSKPVKRTVWQNTNGTRLLTVSGLVKPGTYEVKKTVNESGNIVLELEEVENG